ncbi:MAG TPA: sensor domain-containing diguanylate cyclase [Thermoanaerobaculia bacterium]|nr:sensor domain-containing diguanylate cyclase [Thermoanaerobaculia bacterium]
MSEPESLVRQPLRKEQPERKDMRRAGTGDGEAFHCIDPASLERFLQRRRANPYLAFELNLAENLVEILRKANQFVPSAAGSILLDDPAQKRKLRPENRLTFIAAFGDKSVGLVGREIRADRGIAGHVYASGRAYSTDNAAEDPHFYGVFDEETDYTTRTLVAIPIRIEQEVCGVLELINRQGSAGYSGRDLNLLEIFADYISISIQNVLDGRQAQEFAKRDNLTGLYNDRYLHIALTQALEHCLSSGEDLAVLFLDLDFFKRVNDTYGHLAGSQVLQEVGGILAGRVAPYGAFAARYGGDEFVLVAPVALDRAVDLAEEVRTAVLATTYCAGSGEIQREPLRLKGVACSVGVATLGRHLGDEATAATAKGTLLRLADAAMYVAKETGRNRTASAGEPVRRR